MRHDFIIDIDIKRYTDKRSHGSDNRHQKVKILTERSTALYPDLFLIQLFILVAQPFKKIRNFGLAVAMLNVCVTKLVLYPFSSDISSAWLTAAKVFNPNKPSCVVFNVS